LPVILARYGNLAQSANPAGIVGVQRIL